MCFGTNTLIAGFVKKSNDKSDLSTIDNQISVLEQEISILREQQINEFRANGLSSKYYELDRQLNLKNSQETQLHLDKFEKEASFPGFFVGAGVVIIVFGMTAGGLYSWAYGRNITAFSAQQTMPVAQEGLEQMAPTLGKISEEITKGITKGKSQNQKNSDK